MKHIKIIFTVLTLAIFTVSCDDYKDFEQDRPAVVGFTGPASINLPVQSGNSTREREIPVFVSTSSNVDRTFTASAVDGTIATSDNYSLSSVVIPANERTGILLFTAIDATLTSEEQPVVIAFDNAEGIVSGTQVTVNISTQN